MQVLERWRTMVLVDFSVRINLGEKSALEYHMGFPSNEPECILVKSGNEELMKANDSLMNEPTLVENGWHTDMTRNTGDSIVRVTNEISDFSVNKRSSFVTSPSVIDDTSGVTANVFSKVLSHVTQGRLS